MTEKMYRGEKAILALKRFVDGKMPLEELASRACELAGGDCKECVLHKASRHYFNTEPNRVAVCREQIQDKLWSKLSIMRIISYNLFADKISRKQIQKMLKKDFEFKGYMLDLRGNVRSKQEALNEDKKQLVDLISQVITTLAKLKEKNMSTTDAANAMGDISDFIDYAQKFIDKYSDEGYITTNVRKAMEKIEKLKKNRVGQTYRPLGPDNIPTLTSFNPGAYISVLAKLKANI